MSSEKLGARSLGNRLKEKLTDFGAKKSGEFARATIEAATKRFDIEGKENIPDGGCLIISNHSSHADGWLLWAALSDQKVGVVEHRDMDGPWNIGVGFYHLQQKLRGSPVIRPVASHLEATARDAVTPESFVGRVVAREQDPEKRGADMLNNMQALKDIVEKIASGEKVIFFPEGIFFKENDSHLRPTANGIKAIAKAYERETGAKLQIVPAGITGGNSVFGSDPSYFGPDIISAAKQRKDAEVTIRFGEAFTISGDKKEDFDAIFREKVGGLLPEEYQPRPMDATK